ncbi:T9SS type A sorting domain-containing protein [Chryseobacterium sp. GMJ5]|uniref:T9SS type A sorting domain-containing protein n=1 Tax=Chryseobacterium gilvum TaxID=2976534 RepID=A0ABT2W1I8_9FLAO|nr:T9SS type A sorting domain-containing protein [Chryseobacterium gilvum]MCU7615107.1 T9SS type A sorting domain-containing protein [Chryseobacterium gilvum]
MNLKLQHVSKASMTFLMALFSISGWAQIFEQDFNSSSTVSSYVSATTPNSGQFNAISTSGSGTVLSINGGKLRFARTGNAGAYTRTTDLTPTPQLMIYQFDLAVSNNTAAVTNAATWQIGSAFTTGNSTEANSIVHSRLGLNLTATNGSFSLRDIGGSLNSSVFSGTQNIFWVINNTGATAFYLAPDNTVGTLSNDEADLWVGTTKALTSLPATTATQSLTDFKFVISNGTANVDIDNLKIYSGSNITVWNGTTWSNGTPSSTLNAAINDNYTGTGFTAKTLIVNSGFTLTINSGQTVTTGNLTNNGAVIVNDGGNLIQTAAGTYSGTGTFTVNKNGASALDKYAFWSSPVASQNLATMYGAGLTPSFITEYNTATDYFVTATSNTSVVGKGYSIKTPAAAASGIFIGTPNNGAQTYTLATTGSGHNLVGNPYPSNLDLVAFYNANSGRINSTFYFWDNTSNSVTTQGGTTSVNIGYATYNALSQTWAAAPNSGITPAGNGANIGQGFFVQTLATPTDTSLSFTNDMRVATTGTFFNKTTNNTEGKFWLRINSSYNTNNTLAVAYLAPASDSFDNYDSKAIATGSDAFYTMADAQKLLIQGKAGFDTDDVVPVGNKYFQNGNFVISLIQKEGIFNAGQPVYLHDKVSGTYTNLQNGTYSFTANSGEFTERFEIVYKLNVLATTEVEKAGLEVYRDGEDFVVRNTKNIDSVTVYDAAGRMITKITANSKLIRIPVSAKGMYILKAVSEGKEYSKKIIK